MLQIRAVMQVLLLTHTTKYIYNLPTYKFHMSGI
jgi:hypothetical protein